VGPEKNRSNEKKHSLTFETASLVFGDPNWVLREDRVLNGEQRWHAIGIAQQAVLVVVHLYREVTSNGEEIVRIISAREAGSRECRIYLEQTPD
jgi:uncharacterized DUF497 family protein